MIARRACLGTVAGAVLAASLPTARAQALSKTPRVGFLTGGRRPEPGPSPTWFEEGLQSLGYEPGRNIFIEYRAAAGQLDLLPRYATELVALPVDVIVLGGPAGLRPALAATRHIPIVMIASSIDPVGEGVAESLAKPGGNVTGLTYGVGPERFGKQLELLKQAAPQVTRVAVWWDMELAIFHRHWAAPLELAARRLGLTVIPPQPVLNRDAVVATIEAMKTKRSQAILIVIGGPTLAYRDFVAAVALQHGLPTVAAFKEFVRSGGLLSYGPDLPALHRRGAVFVHRILKGEAPGALPIELPAQYELAVNTRTARGLGLVIPPSVLLRADEVIE